MIQAATRMSSIYSVTIFNITTFNLLPNPSRRSVVWITINGWSIVYTTTTTWRSIMYINKLHDLKLLSQNLSPSKISFSESCYYIISSPWSKSYWDTFSSNWAAFETIHTNLGRENPTIEPQIITSTIFNPFNPQEILYQSYHFPKSYTTAWNHLHKL